jgi:pimeloyl-ACP methyl ester carboxylesterase
LVIPETRHARGLDGTPLAYQVIGEGSVDLVWSFSFLSDLATIWEYEPIATFFRGLASKCRLVLYDRRGTGRSGRQAEAPDLTTCARDLMSIADTVGAEQPFVGGPEIGGALSAVFAATYPARAAGVVWYGPFAQSMWAPDYPWGMSEEEAEEDDRVTTEGWGKGEFAAAFVARNAPSIAGDLEAIRFFSRWMRATTKTEDALRLFRLWYEIKLQPILTELTVPTLLITRGAGRDEAAYVRSLIPRARLIELPGENFMPFFDSDPIIDAIGEFVAP